MLESVPLSAQPSSTFFLSLECALCFQKRFLSSPGGPYFVIVLFIPFLWWPSSCSSWMKSFYGGNPWPSWAFTSLTFTLWNSTLRPNSASRDSSEQTKSKTRSLISQTIACFHTNDHSTILGSRKWSRSPGIHRRSCPAFWFPFSSRNHDAHDSHHWPFDRRYTISRGGAWNSKLDSFHSQLGKWMKKQLNYMP